jgi:NAD(P)-dependent dehydrogenase (short-subunit alcohol dehydrogenase family)
MYMTSSVAPVFIVHNLFHGGLLPKGSKVVLVSSESGSITLRHESEGGSNFGHHASKAALNMAGKLLSLDLKEHQVIISIVHPGFMRTEMTRNVGFDKVWDEFNGRCKSARHPRPERDCQANRAELLAVTPDEAAKSLMEWTDALTMSQSGQYWAPRGPKDIGTAEPVLGKGLSTPLQLPW